MRPAETWLPAQSYFLLKILWTNGFFLIAENIFLFSAASSVRTITRMMQLRLLDVKKNFAAWVIKEVTKTKRKAHQQERRRGGLLAAIVAFCETPKLDIKWHVWLFTDVTALLWCLRCTWYLSNGTIESGCYTAILIFPLVTIVESRQGRIFRQWWPCTFGLACCS